MTVNLIDGWFCDRAPGQGKPVTAGAPVNGVVGVGLSSLPASDTVLPTAGDTIPDSGTSPVSGLTRQQMFLAFKDAVGFGASTLLHGFPSVADSTHWSMSLWVNYAVRQALFIPNSSQGSFFRSSVDLSHLTTKPYFQFIPTAVDISPNGAGIAVIDGGYPNIISDFTSFPDDDALSSKWAHLMASAKITASGGVTGMVYLNDTELVNGTIGFTTQTAFPFGSGEYTQSGLLHGNCIGSGYGYVGGPNVNDQGGAGDITPVSDGLYCGMAECWMSMSQFIDWSVAANRAKFHITDILQQTYTPCNLGKKGALPTGTAPTVYFRGGPSVFPINRVTGNSVSLLGVLTSIDDPPV